MSNKHMSRHMFIKFLFQPSAVVQMLVSRNMIREWKTLFSLGGILLFVGGILAIPFIILIPLTSSIFFPSSIQNGLAAINSNVAGYEAMLLIFAAIDTISLIAVLAISLALSDVSKTVALLAFLLLLCGIFIDLAADVPLHFALVSAASSAAGSALQYAESLLSAANISAYLAQVYYSISIVMLSTMMWLSRRFSRIASVSGVLSGLFTLPLFAFFGAAWSAWYGLGVAFGAVWSFSAGYSLLRLQGR